MKKIWKTT